MHFPLELLAQSLIADTELFRDHRERKLPFGILFQQLTGADYHGRKTGARITRARQRQNKLLGFQKAGGQQRIWRGAHAGEKAVKEREERARIGKPPNRDSLLHQFQAFQTVEYTLAEADVKFQPVSVAVHACGVLPVRQALADASGSQRGARPGFVPVFPAALQKQETAVIGNDKINL